MEKNSTDKEFSNEILVKKLMKQQVDNRALLNSLIKATSKRDSSLPPRLPSGSGTTKAPTETSESHQEASGSWIVVLNQDSDPNINGDRENRPTRSINLRLAEFKHPLFSDVSDDEEDDLSVAKDVYEDIMAEGVGQFSDLESVVSEEARPEEASIEEHTGAGTDTEMPEAPPAKKRKLNLKVRGAPPAASWDPSEEVIDWFKQVSDIELGSEELNNIKKEYVAKEEVAQHFTPPKFPTAIWNLIKNHKEQAYRLKNYTKPKTT